MPHNRTYTATILLGSNLGNREMYLQQAEELIMQKAGAITASSSVYETKAWGQSDQPDYLNKVIRCETSVPPADLLHMCLSIEKTLGRTRKEKWGSRTIDIDLLYAGKEIIVTKNLTVPHPRIQDRRFVLVPLAETDPEGIHPVLNLSNRQLLDKCTDTLNVIKR